MTDKLRDAAQAIVDRWDSPAWGGSAENLRHTGEYIAELRAALAQRVMLADEEIAGIKRTVTLLNMVVTSLDIDFARAVIEAYERKNGLKP